MSHSTELEEEGSAKWPGPTSAAFVRRRAACFCPVSAMAFVATNEHTLYASASSVLGRKMIPRPSCVVKFDRLDSSVRGSMSYVVLSGLIRMILFIPHLKLRSRLTWYKIRLSLSCIE